MSGCLWLTSFHLNQVITQVYLLLCIENLTLVIHIISQGNISKALTPPYCTGGKKPAVNSVPGQFQPQNTVTTYYIQTNISLQPCFSSTASEIYVILFLHVHLLSFKKYKTSS